MGYIYFAEVSIYWILWLKPFVFVFAHSKKMIDIYMCVCSIGKVKRQIKTDKYWFTKSLSYSNLYIHLNNSRYGPKLFQNNNQFPQKQIKSDKLQLVISYHQQTKTQSQ